jgi:hypothetical protein
MSRSPVSLLRDTPHNTLTENRCGMWHCVTGVGFPVPKIANYSCWY